MINVSCKTFYFINQTFLFIRDVFVSMFFSKEHPIGFRGPLLLKSNILLSELPELAIPRFSKTF